MKLYHGSSFEVENPKIVTSGFYKDFGYGFYCTNIEKQAKRWAMTRGKKHIVNVYNYNENENLNILKFDEMTEEWLDFVIACRKGTEHSYDIVEGLWRMILYGITLKIILKIKLQEKLFGYL